MNQKLEDSLELALGLSEEERDRTSDLNTGFSPESDTWELIVKYSGDIERIADDSTTIETL